MDHQCDYSNLQSMYFNLLYDEDSSEEIQLACVEVIQKILGHIPEYILATSSSQWIKCLQHLLHHPNTDVRKAFSAQIGIFVKHSIVICLFPIEDDKKKSCERKFFDLIKYSLAESKDPPVTQTLLETTAEVMAAADIDNELFLSSLFLLIDHLDHHKLIVRLDASTLINRSCRIHVKEGPEMLLSRASHIENELFDYLSVKLPSHQAVVIEFAKAILGIETKKLVMKMAPVVLPKLLVNWAAENDKADDILKQLAVLSETDVVNLIKTWLPRILVFALNKERKENVLTVLRSKLRFCNEEIFAAALPALLDGHVCFCGHC